MNQITLNCIIVPFGQLYGLSHDRVTPAVTVNMNQTVSELEAIIQRNLGAPFNNVRLQLYQIPDKTLMQPNDSISTFFNEQPRLDYFHIAVHPL